MTVRPTIVTTTNSTAALIEFLMELDPACMAQGCDALALDSVALIQLMLWLEGRYGINFAAVDIEPDDLRSMRFLLHIAESRTLPNARD